MKKVTQSYIPFQPNPFFQSQNEIVSYKSRENCTISQKLPDSGTQMGTMESLPQEFHQVIACNSEQEHIKDADAKPLKGQIKIPQPFVEQCPFKTSLLS